MQQTRVQEQLEKNARWFMTALVVYALVRGYAGAATQVLAFDEILTRIVASQPSVREIWVALSKAVDGQAPAHYLIERGAMHVTSNLNIALRLPAIAGTAGILICLFLYMRKRNGEWIAFLCTFFMLSTSVFRYFGDVARPYAVLLASFTFALVCYQRLPSLFWTILLALSLALAECLHYYAVFVLIAFGLAESAVLLMNRRFRWQAWVALAFGVLPLWFVWPLLLAMKAYLGVHYWTHFGASDVVRVYGSLLWTPSGFGFGIMMLCGVGVVIPYVRASVNGSSDAKRTSEGFSEMLLIIGFLLLPFIVFVITRIMHGAMMDRYAIAVVLGFPLALARIFSRASPRVVALYALFLFSSVGLNEIGFWRSVHALPTRPLAPPVETFAESVGHPEIPVVIANGLTYLPLAYYASPEWRVRFVYVGDPNKALQITGTDNVDKVLRNLTGYFPVEIKDYSEFIQSHRAFLLYREEPSAGFEWLPLYLSSHGAKLEVVKIDQGRVMYLVTVDVLQRQE